MALIKVYDLQNVEHELESIDARECCKEMGWTLLPQQPADPKASRDEMKAFLTEKNIPFAANIKGTDLEALYAAEKAKAE